MFLFGRSRGGRAVAGLVALGAGAGVLAPGTAQAKPGDVLSAKTLVPTLAGKPALAGSKAWKITFRSTTALGRAITETGTVLVPTAKWTGKGPRPLVGFAPGTQGLADRCAASTQLANGTQYETPNIGLLLAKGWAVAMPDYQGIGGPGTHPYAIGPSLGPALLDAMRAARSLPAAGVAAKGPAAIMGYSEGGGSAGWAAQLQPTYAPDLPLKAASVGGVIADPRVIAASLNKGPYAFLLLYAAIGYDAAYPELHLTRMLTPAGLTAWNRLKDSCITEAIGLLGAFDIAKYSKVEDALNIPALVRRQKQATLGASIPKTPTLILHATKDDVLPFEQAATLEKRWCTRGANVRLVATEGDNHLSGAFVAAAPAVEWLAKGFAGTTPTRPRSCR